ncbi:MAG: HEAT repeat domain-containing protein [Candidatus Heimdallarchaeaceae archaeon]
MNNSSELDLNTVKNKFLKKTDNEKIELLVELEKLPRTKELADFLFNIIKSEKYDKVRIKCIMLLSSFNDQEVIRSLKELYYFERHENVRLAMIEAIGKNLEIDSENFLISVAYNDRSRTIQGMALKNLHERGKIDKTEMSDFLVEFIRRARETFPIQMALSLIPFYANETTIEKMKHFYLMERDDKMKQLMYKSLTTICNKLNIKTDFLEEDYFKRAISEETFRKNSSKKRKQKDMKKDFLFFD